MPDCKTCNDDFDKCEECQEGYYVIADGTCDSCVKIDAHCESCDNEAHCT